MKQTYLIIIFFYFLNGCASTYGPATEGSSGHSEYKIKENIFQVTFKGNSRQSRDDVRMRLIYRCSEVTVQNGFSHFILLKDDSYKHIGKREFGNSDLSFETTTTMSGGINNRVKSNFGAQDSDAYFVGIFTIKILKNPENMSISALSFLKSNSQIVKK
ncbi:MAG: hypothetical protein HOK52_03320 [Candidatus Marinimicrobia bacterium]|jgi:hypothetical protein|nr:hypothetical protein [Candidatus Neomarinimicrobiota bacterium]MBT3938047.1 hypothetical protein [Candidatus Neomarinimicrobiota bacterium]MBT3961541.1 hypothetical protein [Candidatus Neomarinimicrobiota bacterium]MBT4382071.1 hypothetical protein [Candidatus Neomarinimicrobiota bacterium]MBT4636074.1 hypothetical protein [Candidatus Neomarinimicrobiota bacterium]|tara:strand:+ start:176 stop:652 length:477 start_codon:yes stop_codon:yes gene_type:complete